MLNSLFKRVLLTGAISVVFASLDGMAITITNSTVADTYIESGDVTANGSMTSMPISDDGAGNERWGFVRWDLSNLPAGANIVGAEFRMLQSDYGVGDGLDVYAINSGNWQESTLTWDIWNGMSTDISLLGVMSPIVRFSTGACTFSNTNLLALVRQWHSGETANYGLLLKWHYETQWGSDNFIPREHPYDPPQLVIQYSVVPPFGSVLTNDVVADTEIDQHINYGNANLNGTTSMRVETRSTAYTNPVESPQSWALLRWDLIEISPAVSVSNATLRIIQTDSAVETVDVYGIESGAWDVDTVTWNNWVGTESLQLLGTMTNAVYPDGVTYFTSPELTDFVQDWIRGSHDNLGVVLKWSGAVGQGDGFIAMEHDTLDPAQLLITTKSPARTRLMLFH